MFNRPKCVEASCPNVVFQPALEKLKIAAQFREHVGFSDSKTTHRCVQEMIVDLYTQSCRSLASIIDHYNVIFSKNAAAKEDLFTNTDDTVVAWLNHVELDNEDIVRRDTPPRDIPGSMLEVSVWNGAASVDGLAVLSRNAGAVARLSTRNIGVALCS